MELIRTHDALFKFVFGEPEQMAELLRAALPASIADAIDGSTLQRAPGSFVDKALGERHTDLLFTVRVSRTPVLLYVVPEHKSGNDPDTAWQLAVYVVRILEQWCRDHPDATRLPAVLPLVVYHGDAPWRSPRSTLELIDLTGFDAATAAFLAEHQLQLSYALFDLSAVDEAALDAMRLSAVAGLTLRFAQFLRSCPLQDAGPLLRLWQPIFTRLLEHRRGADVLFALITWYTAHNSANHETLRTVMTKIREEIPPMRSCLDMLFEMGEERGLEKGRRTVLTEQLQARFGKLPASLTERIQQADTETLQRWSLAVLTATSAEAALLD